MQHPSRPALADGSRYRPDPECVVLGVRPGVTPSENPPVRIFLGTEDPQYRAERVFFYSIEKHRDPSRVYEVHLMKNLAGFRRKSWRTGFTQYRFGIPEFAGSQGRAIYNDVDQIYLTDPAELFDLEMGTHGYLAISAQDTSVMLIDCAKMMPYWNRQAAATGKKAGLTNGPASVPGLWGALDRGWNARDVEYAEGASKVLHYTALHQQPWHPFPEVFSYHPNPLAYLWHELERNADANGYQVFSRAAPSAGFAAALAAELPAEVAPPSPKAVEMIAATRPKRVLQLGSQSLPAELMEGAKITEVDLADEAWPEGDFDVVIACGALDRVPVEDLPWLLDQAFSHARKVYLAVQGDAGAVGDDVHLAQRTAAWWRSRLVDAASRHPDVSWHVDVSDGAAVPTAFQVRRVERDRPARVWALIDDRPAVRAQVMHLARALDGEIETKRLAYTPLCALPNLLLGASRQNIDATASDPMQPPWPDLVIGWGRRSVPVARWIRAQSGGQTRLVQLGHPRAPFEAFDLIVTTPQYGLPVRPNIQHNAAPLAGWADTDLDAVRVAWEDHLGHLPRPYVALILGEAPWPHRWDEASLRQLGEAASARAKTAGGTVLIATETPIPRGAFDALQGALEGPHELLGAGEDGLAAALALADHCIAAGASAPSLAGACAGGRLVTMYELPSWREQLPLLGRLEGLLPTGLRGTSRGTPFQQTFVGRFVDRLIEEGVVAGRQSLDGVRSALAARGLVSKMGVPPTRQTPTPLDDLDVTVARIRRLLGELSDVW